MAFIAIDPDANLGQLIDNLVDTSSKALDNIVPAVGRTLSSLGVVVGKVHEGTTNMAPNRYLKNALQNNQAELEKIMGSVLRKLLS